MYDNVSSLDIKNWNWSANLQVVQAMQRIPPSWDSQVKWVENISFLRNSTFLSQFDKTTSQNHGLFSPPYKAPILKTWTNQESFTIQYLQHKVLHE